MAGFFNRIFKKEEIVLNPADLSVLKSDVHSHLLPGLDDGVKTVEEALEILRKFKEAGYKKIITTPHVMSDYYRNSPEIIVSALKDLKERAEIEKIDIELEAAAEYYLDSDFEKKIESKELLTFGSRYVLFELSFFYPPESLHSVVFSLQTNGYIPVLAHPERYSYWHKDFEKYETLKDKGVIFQMNIGSLTGHYSLEVQKIAEKLADHEMIELIGSDCHNMNHLLLLNEARNLPYMHKLINSGKLINHTL